MSFPVTRISSTSPANNISRLNENRPVANIDRRAFFKTVAPLILMIIIQAMIAIGCIDAMSAVRAHVSGESNWSREQKKAIHYLEIYNDNGDERNYANFLHAMAVPLGDMEARHAMEAAPPDVSAATDGFRRGQINTADIRGMISLFLHFQNAPYLKDSIAAWRATDAPLREISSLGESIHAQFAYGRSANAAAIGQQILQIDQRLSPLAQEFSETLGAGSRAIQSLLILATVGTASLLALIIAWRMRKFFRERRGFENALRSEKEQAQLTLQSIGDAIVRVNASGRVEYLNRAAERLIGASWEETRGRLMSSLVGIIDKVSGQDRIGLIDHILSGAAPDFPAEADYVLVNPTTATPITLIADRIAVGGQTTGAVLVLRDRAREEEFISHLTWQASHDELTGLANRREFERRLGECLKAPATERRETALLLLDLDQFKIVNDTCGHAAGDLLLREVSTLLQMHLRDGDLAARLGGDEFVVLLDNCGVTRAAQVAERVRGAIEDAKFVKLDRRFRTSVSIGLVAVGETASTVAELLGAADVACYLAKEKGRNRVQLHEAEDRELAQRLDEMSWPPKIVAAIEENRFCLHAQQLMPLNGESTGAHFEFLLRLQDESGRLVSPGSFIPAAERFGLMLRLDRWVIDAAFASVHDIIAEPDNCIATCAINLSGAGIGDPSFIEFVQSRFLAHKIAPSLICFEITETAAIANLDAAMKFMKTFKDLGCRFALDDFGAGMSSFAYLKNLPVDYLKIDGSFVKDMLDNPIDRAMVETIARLARTMGKKTVAEFVENPGMIDVLREIGVDYAQGYAIGKPEPLVNINFSKPTKMLFDASAELSVLEMAKIDHILFVKHIRNTVAGNDIWSASRVLDHHNCKFGRWYDSVDDEMRAFPAFRRIAEPHKKVHALGKAALKAHEEQRDKAANALLEELIAASQEVLAGLGELSLEIARQPGRAANNTTQDAVPACAQHGQLSSCCPAPLQRMTAAE